MPDPVDAIVFYVVFLFSATFHEAAHAWVSMRGGDLTAYAGGQVSLDPRPHIRREPFGMVLLPLLTVAMTGWPFGFASAPLLLRLTRSVSFHRNSGELIFERGNAVSKLLIAHLHSRPICQEYD